MALCFTAMKRPLRQLFTLLTLTWSLTCAQTVLAVGETPYSQGYISGSKITYEEHIQNQKSVLEASGFEKWNWRASSERDSQRRNCADCQLYLLPVNTQLESASVYAYLQALENEKATILKLYPSSPREYNFLAQLSVGILGRESLFFRAKRYFLKEYFQPGVNFAKLMRKYMGFTKGVSARNSRGPTQIKDIPKKIADHYKVNSDNLYVPQNAAVATMGYLIEALKDLKYIAGHESFNHIQPSNYADYLPYIYFGSRKAILAKTATPEQNLYVKDMKRYMNFVEVYEHTSSNSKPQLP